MRGAQQEDPSSKTELPESVIESGTKHCLPGTLYHPTKTETSLRDKVFIWDRSVPLL